MWYLSRHHSSRWADTKQRHRRNSYTIFCAVSSIWIFDISVEIQLLCTSEACMHISVNLLISICCRICDNLYMSRWSWLINQPNVIWRTTLHCHEFNLNLNGVPLQIRANVSRRLNTHAARKTGCIVNTSRVISGLHGYCYKTNASFAPMMYKSL